jgi:hypothetical protein
VRGRGSNSSVSAIASPVLVGAVTVLIVIVGVYLAYNANKGLPFVPTYDLQAELPNGQKLIAGNEIRSTRWSRRRSRRTAGPRRSRWSR